MLTGCGSSKPYSAEENLAFQKLQDLVSSKSLKIVSNRAMPMASGAFSRVANSKILGPGNNAGNIDIISNSNFLVIKGNSISGFLPFYGEQHMGGGYNGNHSAIEFSDHPKNYNVIYNDKKHTAEINFAISDTYRSNEYYNIMITLYTNQTSIIRVQSSYRSSIAYTGQVERGDKTSEK